MTVERWYYKVKISMRRLVINSYIHEWERDSGVYEIEKDSIMKEIINNNKEIWVQWPLLWYEYDIKLSTYLLIFIFWYHCMEQFLTYMGYSVRIADDQFYLATVLQLWFYSANMSKKNN